MDSEERRKGGDGAPRRKPVGGFILISITQFIMAWSALRGGHIGLRDLRVWFALWEMRARRCCLDDGQTPEYSTREIQRLIGGAGGESIRECLRRLKAAGLIKALTKETIELATSLDDLTFETDQVRETLGQIPNNARLVPVPRRIVRLIAGGARRTLIATILGHLIRCAYYKGGKVSPSGCVKASWIADVFGISERMVHDQRRHLIELGWLIPQETSQRVLNSHGIWMRINLDWSHDATKTNEAASSPSTVTLPVENPSPASQELAPLQSLFPEEPAPPEETNKPLAGAKNQKPDDGQPASGGPDPGFYKQDQDGKTPEPTLRDVKPEDLRDPARLLVLHAQALEQGAISNSEHDRLNFFAAANHARVIGSVNPPGLFIRIVRSKLFGFLTQDDEDAARAMIHRALYPTLGRETSSRVGPPGAINEVVPPWPSLSDDARFVRHITRVLKAKGVSESSCWRLVNREKPEWTRDRWDAALAELQAERLPSHACVSNPRPSVQNV
jgi:hypothetical protein